MRLPGGIPEPGPGPDSFLAEASELLAIPSTADRPGELRRALDFVLDFVGPAVTVERFESGGSPAPCSTPAARERISASS
jgi:succinyl-diaminopimelate desuccinylase